jgi:predicted TIM-barrel fold metal-dependent hydrolase
MEIIDFRLRPPTGGFLKSKIYSVAENRKRYTQKLGWPLVVSADLQSMDLLFTEMDEAKITTGVVVGRTTATLGAIPNADVAQIVTDHPDRFVGIGSADSSDRKTAFAMIDEILKLGLKAVNLEPGVSAVPMRADDRRLYPIYAKCEDAGLPVVIMAGGGAGPDLSYNDPVAIDRMLADFPSLKVVCSHGGWPFVQEILGVAFRRENLYLCPDMYLRGLPGTAEYLAAANGFLSERILFGTAYPFCPLKPYVDWFLEQKLSETSLKRVLSENAKLLLSHQ